MKYIFATVSYGVASIPLAWWLYILYDTAVMYATGTRNIVSDDPAVFLTHGGATGVVFGFLAAVMGNHSLSSKDKMKWAVFFVLLPVVAPLFWLWRSN